MLYYHVIGNLIYFILFHSVSFVIPAYVKLRASHLKKRKNFKCIFTWYVADRPERGLWVWFTDFSFTGVFFATCRTNDNIKKIVAITSEMCLQIQCFATFLNVSELPKRKLVQHSHLLSGHSKTPTCSWKNSASVWIFLRLSAYRLLFITLRFSKPSTLFCFKRSIDFSIVS